MVSMQLMDVTQVAMFLSVISMVVASTPDSYSPAGVLMCKRRCQEFGGCLMVDYVLKDLRCRLLSGRSNGPGISDAIRLHVKDVSAYKAINCPQKYQFIFTKKASYACVDPGTATGRTKTQSSSERNGLLTFSKDGRTRYQINLMFLSSKEWFSLHVFKAKQVLALTSQNNFVFWCQRGPNICGRFMYEHEMKTNTKLETRKMIGSSVAVDESEDVVFVAAGGSSILVLNWSLDRKKGVQNVEAHMTVMSVEIIPILKRLYLTFKYSLEVIAVNYHGERQEQFIFRERGLFLDFSPDGQRLYTTYVNGTMHVVQISYDSVSTIKTIQVSWTSAKVRVLAFNDKVLAFKEEMFYIYDSQYHMVTGGFAKMIFGSRMEPRTPVASYVQPPIQGSFIEEKTAPRASNGTFPGEEDSARSHIQKSHETPLRFSDIFVKQWLLSVTTTLRKSKTPFGKSPSIMKVFLGSLTSHKWHLLAQFNGEHVAMDFSENVLYQCQRKPDGIFTLNFQDGPRQKEHKKIVDGECTSVAVDPVLMRVFFIKSYDVLSYNLQSKEIETLPITTSGRMEDYRILAETREHMVYVYRLGDMHIQKYDHKGRFQTLFSTKEPIKDLVIYSGKSASTLYCVHKASPSEVKRFALPGAARTINLNQTGSLTWKPISSMAATNNKIILTNGRCLRVVDRKTLRGEARWTSRTFKGPFENILVIDL